MQISARNPSWAGLLTLRARQCVGTLSMPSHTEPPEVAGATSLTF